MGCVGRPGRAQSTIGFYLIVTDALSAGTVPSEMNVLVDGWWKRDRSGILAPGTSMCHRLGIKTGHMTTNNALHITRADKPVVDSPKL